VPNGLFGTKVPACQNIINRKSLISLSSKVSDTVDSYKYSEKLEDHCGKSKLYVYKSQSGEEVICKRHDKVRGEAAMHRLVNNIPGVVRMIKGGTFIHEHEGISDSNCLFLEKYEGDLSKLLEIRTDRSRKAGNLGAPFTVEEALPHMVRLLTTLEIMHSRNIFHGDIKPHNVFYDNEETLYLADFDLSVLYDKRRMENFRKAKEAYNSGVNADYLKALSIDYWPGTYIYGAPENLVVNDAFLHVGPKYPVSDIWSLGCVFFEMFTSRRFNSTKFYKSEDGKRLLYEETRLGDCEPLNLIRNVTEDMNRKGFEIYDKDWEKVASKIGKDGYSAMTALHSFLVHAVPGKSISASDVGNLKSLFKGMLDPNFLTRLSAKECLENPLFKDHLHIHEAMWKEYSCTQGIN